MTITIRQVEMSDANQLLRVVPKIDEETDFMVRSFGEFSLNLKQEEEFILSKLNNERDLFLVALFNDEIIGSLVFSGSKLKKYSHSGEFGMGIIKDYWGKGIGSSLLETLLNWASLNEIKKINLKVIDSNKQAIKLYEKFEFKIEGEIDCAVKLKDGYHKLLVMGKIID